MATTQSAVKKKTNGTHPVPASTANRLKVSLEGKQKAIDRINAGDRAEDVAAELGVTPSAIYLWRRGIGLGRVGRRAKTEAAPVTATAEPARKAVLSHSDTVVRDAILYLRNARSAIMRDVKNGKHKELDESQLLTLLALRVLEGG